jgi:hypothetical protein
MPVRKRTFCALALLLCVAAPARAQVERSRHFSDEVQYKAIESVVRITLTYEHGWGQGSGVCVGFDGQYSYILTCAHVLDGADKATGTKLEFFTKQTYPNPCRAYTGRFEFRLDRPNDLALIKVATAVPAQIKICPESFSPPMNTAVLAVGCGKGAPPVAQVGKLVGYDPTRDFVHDRGSIGGRSGGAILSAQGLIGILSRGAEDVTVAVNHWKTHQFLKGTQLVAPPQGAPGAPTPASLADTTWTGSEALDGFGKLTFQLHADGTAVMIDAKSTVKGRWAQQGQRVVIQFQNCVYAGQLNGQRLSGSAQFVENGRPHGRAWAFAVVRQ